MNAQNSRVMKNILQLAEQNFWLLVCSILVIGFTLRIYKTESKEPWFDEYCTLRGAMGLEQVIRQGFVEPKLHAEQPIFTTHDLIQHRGVEGIRQATLDIDRGNGFFANLAIRGWIEIVGMNPSSVYVFISLIATLNIVLLIVTTQLIGLTRIQSLFAGSLMAISPLAIQFSDREIRSYVFAVMGCLLATIVCIRIMQRKNHEKNIIAIDAIFYAISISIAFFSHYLTVSILCVHGVMMLVSIRTKSQWYSYSIACIIFIALCSIWLYHGGWAAYQEMSAHSGLWRTRALEPGSSLSPSLGNIIVQAYHQLSNVLAVRTGVTNKTLWGSAIPFVLVSVCSLTCLIVGIGKALQKRANEKDLLGTQQSEKQQYQEYSLQQATLYWLVIFSACAPTLLAIVLAFTSGHTISLIFRYATFSAPFGSLVIVVAIIGLRSLSNVYIRWCGIACVVLQIALIPASLFSTYAQQTKQELPYFHIARSISREVQPNDTIMHVSGYEALHVNLFLLKQKISNVQHIDTTIQGRTILRNQHRYIIFSPPFIP